MANWIAFVSILQLAKSIECKTISLNSPSERRVALLLMGQRHATALHEYIASFIEQSMSRATLSWVLGELSLPALHFVLFILLFYCLNAAASKAREKKEIESERAKGRAKEREMEDKVNTIAIYRIRFDNMFAGIFIISAFMWFPLELQTN